jgi:hypothetical protein
MTTKVGVGFLGLGHTLATKVIERQISLYQKAQRWRPGL